MTTQLQLIIMMMMIIIITRRFITAFTSTHDLSLSWARSIQSTLSYPISGRAISILSWHLRLGLPSGPLPPAVPTTHCKLLSPFHATCPTHPILPNSHFITLCLVDLSEQNYFSMQIHLTDASETSTVNSCTFPKASNHFVQNPKSEFLYSFSIQRSDIK